MKARAPNLRWVGSGSQVVVGEELQADGLDRQPRLPDQDGDQQHRQDDDQHGRRLAQEPEEASPRLADASARGRLPRPAAERAGCRERGVRRTAGRCGHGGSSCRCEPIHGSDLDLVELLLQALDEAPGAAWRSAAPRQNCWPSWVTQRRKSTTCSPLSAGCLT